MKEKLSNKNQQNSFDEGKINTPPDKQKLRVSIERRPAFKKNAKGSFLG